MLDIQLLSDKLESTTTPCEEDMFSIVSRVLLSLYSRVILWLLFQPINSNAEINALAFFSLIFLATADVLRIKQMMRRMTFSLIFEFSLYFSVLPSKRRLLRIKMNQ